MKVWEKARDKELEKLKNIENEIRQKWEHFSETGECKKIMCGDCPFYRSKGNCRVRQPFHDDVLARENLNKEI